MPRPTSYLWSGLRRLLDSRPASLQYRKFSASGTSRGGPRWTKEEDEILTTMRAAGKPRDEIQTMLPGRTAAGIDLRWSDIGPRTEYGEPKFNYTPRWTRAEISKLVSLHQSGLSTLEINKSHFPQRALREVERQVRDFMRGKDTICLGRRKWIQEDAEKLLSLREAGHSNTEIAARLGRTIYAVNSRALKLKLRVRRISRFTAEEDATILRLSKLGKTSPQDYQAELPHRSSTVIVNRKKHLLSIPVKRTYRPRKPQRTTKQVEELYKQVMDMMQHGHSRNETAAALGISFSYVYSLISRKGAVKTPQRPEQSSLAGTDAQTERPVERSPETLTSTTDSRET